ncbi:hypothetical protein GQ44DRAFT_741840 [Phaeosphaeriaceae sp. PMI808]|nr:hypothetical protein GQ44DRAFT_741840 [Phaeosphaeriaceae sp. PMI808]
MLSSLYLVPVVIGYLAVVRFLRYRRIERTQKHYGYTPAEFKNLSYRDAQSIIAKMGLYECPWTFLAGKDFAFLRAFAIPGISKVSVGAREMVDRVGKRYADTTVLVGEFLIHSHYGSKIKMDQMVYTLCLLTCEALQWIDRYDWRKTVPLEKHASWVFWYEVGRRMGLENVPQSFEACAAFIEEFEALNMAPSEDNALIAKGVFSLYASTIPAFVAPIVRPILVAFMDSHLSEAFKLSDLPSSFFQSFLGFLLVLRKHFVRHFMLPRYSTLQVFGEQNAAGYRPMMFWEIEPWYVTSSKSCSWIYTAYTRFFGLPMAGDAKFRPEGYRLEEIGPKHLEGGQACSFATFGQFSNTIYTRGGCPLNFEEAVKCP